MHIDYTECDGTHIQIITLGNLEDTSVFYYVGSFWMKLNQCECEPNMELVVSLDTKNKTKLATTTLVDHYPDTVLMVK